MPAGADPAARLLAEFRTEPVTAREAGDCAVLPADASQLELDPAGLSSRLTALVHDRPRWGRSLRKRPVYVCRITPAYFVGYRNAVLTSEARPITESLYLSSVEATAFHVTRATVSHADEPGFVIASAVSGHYFHWTLQCLPSLLLVPDEETTLVGPPLNSWQRRSMELAGAGDRRFDYVPMGVVRHYPALTYPSTLSGDGLYHGLRPFFGRMREGVVGDGPDDLLVYVARTDTDRRRLLNERALIDALEALGFHILTPATCTLDEQIDVFGRARAIVGAHGGGLTNIVYSRPGTVLLELHAAHYLNSCYFAVAQSFGLEYHADCFGPLTVEQRRHAAPWTVDVPRVLVRLRRILG